MRFTRRNRSLVNRCASGRTLSPGCSGSGSINPRAESRSIRLRLVSHDFANYFRQLFLSEGAVLLNREQGEVVLLGELVSKPVECRIQRLPYFQRLAFDPLDRTQPEFKGRTENTLRLLE